jgi:hypothetical protein
MQICSESPSDRRRKPCAKKRKPIGAAEAALRRAKQDLIRDSFWRAPDDALFTRAEVAAVCRKSLKWLEMLSRKGGGPLFKKVGRRVVYEKRDVKKFLSQFQKQESTSSGPFGSWPPTPPGSPLPASI